MAANETYAPGQLYAINLNDLLPDPEQPRKYMDPAALMEMVESIKEHGIIQSPTFRVSEERDKASRAYVAPLKDKIERLGRLVFDPSFQVTINDDLKIISRTVSGVTVPCSSVISGR